MEQRLSKIEDRIDSINDKLADIQLNLREHMRRTEIAESNIEGLANTIKPIQEHVALIGAFAKILPILGSLLAAAIGAWKYFTK